MHIKLLNKEQDKKAVDFFAAREWKRFNKERKYQWNAKKYVLAAFNKKRVVGFASFKITGGVAYLSQLITLKEMHGNGIGNSLIKRFESFSKTKRCHVAYLETSEKHKEALSFYKNRGYKVVAKMKNNKFYITWYFLAKPL